VFSFKLAGINTPITLNSPRKIQDFLETLKSYNPHGPATYHSPYLVLEKRRANCLEGAIFAAFALRQLGFTPLILDLTAAAQRYRDPVYKSIRELVMSYFHEYTDDYGHKTLRSYSLPVNLKQFDYLIWATSPKPLKYIEDYLFKVKHFSILTHQQIASLRHADLIEIKMGKLKIWP